MGVCEFNLFYSMFAFVGEEGDPLVCQLVSARSLLQLHAMTIHSCLS